MTALLNVQNLSAFYGPSQALFDVSFSITEGHLVALMGRNGMGKSTTVGAICRMVDVRGGQIAFAGHNLLKLKPHLAVQTGLGLVPEGRRCFPNLTVRENCMAAARPGHWTFEQVSDLFPRLAERRDQMANTLSGGEQQMLAIARALMTNPKLLLLDEATEGLAPVVRQEIWAALHELKGTGLSILLIDKTLSELLEIADHCVILEKGETVWDGVPADLTTDISNRFLGV
ncbi:MAG: ABC transporter ATP-binding protein [Rhizobiaceae bacterium]|nr:ABC transporter ATP-binding protein [Hyphomicrobiales bacterium]NRB29135.1 ABC transporter ATP-binding protein [Rhizobiaceae bacterium]